MSDKALNEVNILKFRNIAKTVNLYTRKYGFELNFTGYESFLSSYNSATSNDLEVNYEIIKQSLLWSDYFIEVEKLINMQIDDKTIIYENLLGTGLKHLQEVKRELFMLKLFKNHLKIQSKFCVNIYYRYLTLHKRSIDRLVYMSY